MLILTREIGEAITIGDDIVITILKGAGAHRCKLGVDAPKTVKVQREEIIERDAIEARHDQPR